MFNPALETKLDTQREGIVFGKVGRFDGGIEWCEDDEGET